MRTPRVQVTNRRSHFCYFLFSCIPCSLISSIFFVILNHKPFNHIVLKIKDGLRTLGQKLKKMKADNIVLINRQKKYRQQIIKKSIQPKFKLLKRITAVFSPALDICECIGIIFISNTLISSYTRPTLPQWINSKHFNPQTIPKTTITITIKTLQDPIGWHELIIIIID